MSTVLNFNSAEAIQYADLVKGDIRFKILIPTAPKAGDSRKFGFYNVNKDSGIYFEVTGVTFRAVIRDGEKEESTVSAVTFSDDWAGRLIVYRIVWGAGMADFYVEDVKVATLPFVDYDLTTTPLSLYINNGEADDMLLSYVECRDIQLLI
jgi:hypothetical protein